MEEKPQRQCGVCYDKATGLHYGIISCEGCKVRILNLTPGRNSFDDFSLFKLGQIFQGVKNHATISMQGIFSGFFQTSHFESPDLQMCKW